MKALEEMMPQEAEEFIAHRTKEIGSDADELHKFFCYASSAAASKKWDPLRVSAIVQALEEYDVRASAPELLKYLESTDRLNDTTSRAIRMLGKWKHLPALDFMRKSLEPLQFHYMHENAYAGSRSLHHGNPRMLAAYWTQIESLQTAMSELGAPAEHEIKKESMFHFK